MGNEWFYISNRGKKDEQKRDVSRGSEDDLVPRDDDGFTVPDVVPIISVNDEEDDFGEEEE